MSMSKQWERDWGMLGDVVHMGSSWCKSVRLSAPAVKCLPLPWMRSERKTSADGDVALARALQASRFAASADAIEASCEAATAPTLGEFVRLF